MHFWIERFGDVPRLGLTIILTLLRQHFANQLELSESAPATQTLRISSNCESARSWWISSRYPDANKSARNANQLPRRISSRVESARKVNQLPNQLEMRISSRISYLKTKTKSVLYNFFCWKETKNKTLSNHVLAVWKNHLLTTLNPLFKCKTTTN